ncbi:MAG: AgmX/PglI C-terminal domain-containing protein [bacterium]
MRRLHWATALAIATGTLTGAAAGARAAPTITPEIRVRAARVIGDDHGTATVRRVAETGRASLLACYRKNLATHPGEVGLLALSVRIEPTGKASTVQVVTTAINAPLKKCAIQSVQGWRFAPWRAKTRQLATLELVFQLAATPVERSIIKGGIPARLIAGTLEARIPGLLEACLKGLVLKKRRYPPKLRLLTDYDGSVSTAGVTGRLPRLANRTCLVRRMKLWDFPPPDNGHRTWVLYPLLPRAAAAKSQAGSR